MHENKRKSRFLVFCVYFHYFLLYCHYIFVLPSDFYKANLWLPRAILHIAFEIDKRAIMNTYLFIGYAFPKELGPDAIICYFRSTNRISRQILYIQMLRSVGLNLGQSISKLFLHNLYLYFDHWVIALASLLKGST